MFSEKIKGYYVSCGYMGYVGNRYILFATENEYLEYMEVDNGKYY